MKPLVIFLMSVILTPALKADSTPLSQWREAVGLYVDESLDYADTLSETGIELKFWRQKVLQERFDNKLGRLEKVLSESNIEFLEQIEAHIKKNGIESLDDSLLMRLAQLYFDRTNYDLNFKMKKYETQLIQYQTGKSLQRPQMPSPDYSKAVRYSTELIKRFPASPLSDKAHYLLGYCLFEENKIDQAMQVYDRELKANPYSEINPEVQWRLAELNFEKGNYNAALEGYRTLVIAKNAFSKKAAYKFAATLFANGKYEPSAKMFLDLLNQTALEKDGDSPESATLYAESLDYLAHIKAKGVPLNLDSELEAKVTERLAQAYRRIKDEEGFRNTYLKYAAQNPLASRTPKFLTDVIESFETDEQIDKAQGAREKFIANLGPNSAFWQKQRDDIMASTEAMDGMETHILASAQYYAEKSKRPNAISYYDRFIKEFPYSAHLSQAKYELADLYYASAKYGEASLLYRSVAADSATQEYRDESAYGYVLSELKKSGQNLDAAKALKPTRLSSGTLAPSSELSEDEKNFFKAVEFFSSVVPSGARRQKVLYRAAEVFFKHNQFEKTRTALEMLLKDRYSSSISIQALRLVAETYDLENKWELVVETNQRLASLAQVADADSLESDLKFKAGSHVLAEASKLEASGRLSPAANLYDSFAVKFPRSGDTPYALFRSARLYRETSQILESERVVDRLLKEYVGSRYMADAEFLKAANQASLIQFEKAAKLYESFGRKHPRHALSAQAFFNASTLYRNLKNSKQAAVLFEKYAERTPDENVWFELSKLRANSGDKVGATRILSRYTSGRYGLNLKVRALFEKALMSSNREATQICKQIVGTVADTKDLSAYSRHSRVGCGYVLTWSKRDSLVKSFKEDAFRDLLAKYEELKTADKDWYAAAMVDAGHILETHDRKKAAEFFSKAVEVSEGDLAKNSYKEGLSGLKRVSSLENVLVQPESLWPVTTNFPQDIEVNWPPAASALKVAFDQKKWTDVLASTKLYIGQNQGTYLYSVQARAQAELGQWSDARRSLEECVDRTQDVFCAAGFLASGFASEKSSQYAVLVKEALQKASHPSWKLSLAQYAARLGKGDAAVSYVQELVREEPEWAPSYVFLSQFYLENQSPELARIVIDQGIKNTEYDERLQLQKGYLSLNLHLKSEVKEIVDDIQSQNKESTIQKIFVAHTQMTQGQWSLAKETLDFEVDSEPDRTQLLQGQFVLSLLEKNEAKLKELAPLVRESAERDPYGAYLEGIYQTSNRGEAHLGPESFARARRLGKWGKWIDLASGAVQKTRQPASGKAQKNE